MEGPIGNLAIDVPGRTNAGSLLGHLAYDKPDGGENDFADMPPLENALDIDRSSPKQGLSTPTSDIVRVLELGMERDSPALMQAKGSDSQLVVDSQKVTTIIDGHHEEVFAIGVVPSLSCHTFPRKAKSLRDAKALLPNNDMLELKNHFSSLDGLETTNAGGDPHTCTPIIPTAIVEFNYEHTTIEN